MPHTTAYIKRHALATLGGGRIFSEDEDLPLLLARIVAGVFNDRVGEDLEVGKQSLYYPYVITNSMPADLAVVVVAWWTPQREPHWDKIRGDLNACIGWGSSWGSSLRTETHLVVVGDPNIEPHTHWLTRQHTYP